MKLPDIRNYELTNALVSGSAKGSGFAVGSSFHASIIVAHSCSCSALKVDENPMNSSRCVREKNIASSNLLVSEGPVLRDYNTI